MTTSQETIRDTARRDEETYDDVMRLWVDNVQKWVGLLPTPDGKLLDQVVDGYFNVAERVLATQREFAKSCVAVTTSAATSAASAVKHAATTADAKKG